MLDSIELLETIGKDASLRHASFEQLTNTLDQAGASAAFKAAVMTGDKAMLSAELGGSEAPMWFEHHSNAIWQDDI